MSKILDRFFKKNSAAFDVSSPVIRQSSVVSAQDPSTAKHKKQTIQNLSVQEAKSAKEEGNKLATRTLSKGVQSLTVQDIKAAAAKIKPAEEALFTLVGYTELNSPDKVNSSNRQLFSGLGFGDINTPENNIKFTDFQNTAKNFIENNRANIPFFRRAYKDGKPLPIGTIEPIFYSGEERPGPYDITTVEGQQSLENDLKNNARLQEWVAEGEKVLKQKQQKRSSQSDSERDPSDSKDNSSTSDQSDDPLNVTRPPTLKAPPAYIGQGTAGNDGMKTAKLQTTRESNASVKKESALPTLYTDEMLEAISDARFGTPDKGTLNCYSNLKGAKNRPTVKLASVDSAEVSNSAQQAAFGQAINDINGRNGMILQKIRINNNHYITAAMRVSGGKVRSFKLHDPMGMKANNANARKIYNTYKAVFQSLNISGHNLHYKANAQPRRQAKNDNTSCGAIAIEDEYHLATSRRVLEDKNALSENAQHIRTEHIALLKKTTATTSGKKHGYRNRYDELVQELKQKDTHHYDAKDLQLEAIKDLILEKQREKNYSKPSPTDVSIALQKVKNQLPRYVTDNNLLQDPEFQEHLASKIFEAVGAINAQTGVFSTLKRLASSKTLNSAKDVDQMAETTLQDLKTTATEERFKAAAHDKAELDLVAKTYARAENPPRDSVVRDSLLKAKVSNATFEKLFDKDGNFRSSAKEKFVKRGQALINPEQIAQLGQALADLAKTEIKGEQTPVAGFNLLAEQYIEESNPKAAKEKLSYLKGSLDWPDNLNFESTVRQYAHALKADATNEKYENSSTSPSNLTTHKTGPFDNFRDLAYHYGQNPTAKQTLEKERKTKQPRHHRKANDKSGENPSKTSLSKEFDWSRLANQFRAFGEAAKKSTGIINRSKGTQITNLDGKLARLEEKNVSYDKLELALLIRKEVTAAMKEIQQQNTAAASTQERNRTLGNIIVDIDRILDKNFSKEMKAAKKKADPFLNFVGENNAALTRKNEKAIKKKATGRSKDFEKERAKRKIDKSDAMYQFIRGHGSIEDLDALKKPSKNKGRSHTDEVSKRRHHRHHKGHHRD